MTDAERPAKSPHVAGGTTENTCALKPKTVPMVIGIAANHVRQCTYSFSCYLVPLEMNGLRYQWMFTKVQKACALYFITGTYLLAQLPPKNAQFKHLTTDDGLSNNQIGAILQDREGFIWIGTGDGLNRYDGRHIEIFKHDPLDSTSVLSGSIGDLHQSQDGKLWIATSAGVCVYDKYTETFRSYLSDQSDDKSVSCNLINNLAEDYSGNIWMSTYGCGLKCLNPKTGKFTVYNVFTTDSLSKVYFPETHLTCLQPQGRHGFYVSCFGNKHSIYEVNPRGPVFNPIDIPQMDQYPRSKLTALGVFVDSKKRLWRASGANNHGVDRFDMVTGEFKHYSTSENNLSAPIVQCFLEDSRGNLWLGTIKGLDVFNPLTDKFQRNRHSDLNSRSISADDITSLCEDRQGLIWIGTKTGGVNIYDPQMNQFKIYMALTDSTLGPVNNTIFGLCSDSFGRIWVGCNGPNISCFEPGTSTFRHYNVPLIAYSQRRYPFVNSLQFDRSGNLWFGSQSLVVGMMDTAAGKFSFPEVVTGDSPTFIYDLKIDVDGNVWIGSPAGLNCYTPSLSDMKYFSPTDSNANHLSAGEVMPVYCGRNGLIWMGTRVGGMNVYNSASQKFSHFLHGDGHKEHLNEDVTNSFYEPQEGAMWIGTGGGGLNLMLYETTGDGLVDGRFYAVTQKDGICNNVVNTIVPDQNGNLWLGTGDGLCQITPPEIVKGSDNKLYLKFRRNGEQDNIRNFYKGDGLVSDDFSISTACVSPDGTMYFGTYQGFIEFHPDSLKINEHRPPVYITSLSIFEKPAELDTPMAYKHYIELPYDQNFLSFEFIGLDFAQPEKNKYAYKLEGLNDQWIYCGYRRFATFTNLDPGEYVFRVKACNNDGIWNEQGNWIRIIITPPFWKTIPFYAACSGLAVLLLAAGIKFRERQLRKDKKLLEEKVMQRTQSLLEEKEKVEQANQEIDRQRANILDSINYASRIQTAMMKSEEEIAKHLKGCFIFFRPKDVVSGDFYWFAHHNQISYIAAVDCTGHGVPGALMSMIGYSLLNQIVNERQEGDPVNVLNALHEGVVQALQQGSDNSDSMDGMDLAFVKIDHNKGILQFAGAMNPLYVVSSNDLRIFKGTFASVGGKSLRRDGRRSAEFVSHEINLDKASGLYLFSDGFIDQFGGKDGDSFGTDRFRELLMSIHKLNAVEQKAAIEKAFIDWKGSRNQIDDVLVIGVRLN